MGELQRLKVQKHTTELKVRLNEDTRYTWEQERLIDFIPLLTWAKIRQFRLVDDLKCRMNNCDFWRLVQMLVQMPALEQVDLPALQGFHPEYIYRAARVELTLEMAATQSREISLDVTGTPPSVVFQLAGIQTGLPRIRRISLGSTRSKYYTGDLLHLANVMGFNYGQRMNTLTQIELVGVSLSGTSWDLDFINAQSLQKLTVHHCCTVLPLLDYLASESVKSALSLTKMSFIAWWLAGDEHFPAFEHHEVIRIILQNSPQLRHFRYEAKHELEEQFWSSVLNTKKPVRHLTYRNSNGLSLDLARDMLVAWPEIEEFDFVAKDFVTEDSKENVEAPYDRFDESSARSLTCRIGDPQYFVSLAHLIADQRPCNLRSLHFNCEISAQFHKSARSTLRDYFYDTTMKMIAVMRSTTIVTRFTWSVRISDWKVWEDDIWDDPEQYPIATASVQTLELEFVEGSDHPVSRESWGDAAEVHMWVRNEPLEAEDSLSIQDH